MKPLFKTGLVALLLLFSAGVTALAQTLVHGKITDSSGLPVIGAGVFIKGTTTGVSTDLEGNYQIQAKQGDVLVVSSLGYR